MDRAHELGINYFDTANRYGGTDNAGGTERIIGDWFAQGGGRRHRTVLATKLYGAMGDWPNEGRLSALNIRRACDASLQRLQTDYIDIYQMHHVDRDHAVGRDLGGHGSPAPPGQDPVRRLVELRRMAPGAGAARPPPPRGIGLVSEQSIYSLVTAPSSCEVLPAAQSYGVGVVPWSPLHGGLLAGVLGHARSGEGSRRTGGRAAEALTTMRAAIVAWEPFCADRGEDPADVALAWLLHQPAVTAPIVGPRTVAQLEAATRALGVRLDDAALARLDEIFPGPGGAAPEAYAW